MSEFLLAASIFILATVAVGLIRVLRGPGNAERMMAAQLVGSGGIASLLTAGTATGVSAATELALTLALLATFASIAFVKKGTPRSPDAPEMHGR
jgi:multicomponent Na+:H+ antiporter subunit F